MRYTNYNECMRKALALAKERGVTEQADLDKCIAEIFSNAQAKRYHNDGSEPISEYIKKH